MKYYLTTPIYYVNAAPHIGHAYTTIVADVVRMFKTMQGYEAVLTTGSDEHGVNVERAAERLGKSPRDYCDIIAAEFERQWQLLGLHIDRFQRTTSPQHAAVVQDLFERCRSNGYIYKGAYTGQYCIHDNLYVNDAKPGEACPDCGRPTETITEENFFFKLSAFRDRLLELYEREPLFIGPETRRNEVIAFVKGGLNDLSITRTNIKWGIPVVGEAPHVFYVWFDALAAYMSAVAGQNMWPADLHLIAKEILRFHAIYWPAFLMAAGLDLPKRVFAHGWLLFEESKMSKSRGNVVRPEPIRRVMGTDALRYYLLREVVFGQDGNFSYDALVGRYNSDLANGLGNLTSRTLTMINQYCGGEIPPATTDGPIPKLAGETIQSAIASFEALEFSKALETIWALLSATDKFIVEQAPWRLAKQPESRPRLEATLSTAAEVLRIATVLLAPVLPDSTAKIWALLGMMGPVEIVRLQDLAWGQFEAGQRVAGAMPVFPRIDPKVAIPEMRALEEQEAARQAALVGKAPAPAAEAPPTAEAPAPAPAPKISIDDFAKVEMRVGLVLEAERVQGATKLLKLKVEIGEPEPRFLVAGIAEAYQPEQLIGRKVVIVANLEPRKVRGVLSDGMIVAASLEGGKPVLAGFLEDVPVGARLK
jgi:methionyl-tRNA synthetase